MKACERFIYVENLDIQEGPKQEATRAGRGKTSSVKQALSANAGLMRKMRTAFNIAKGEEEEVSLSLIGQALRRLIPGSTHGAMGMHRFRPWSVH